MTHAHHGRFRHFRHIPRIHPRRRIGTRLRPLTDILPKPLIPFFHEPLVLHAMRRCHECGIREFIINTHHLADAWDRVLPERSWNGCPVHFSHEAVLLDSGGGVKKIEPWAAADEPLLVMNGDTAATFDLHRVIAAHMERRPAVTLALRTDGDKRNAGFDAPSGLVTDMRHALGAGSGSLPVHRSVLHGAGKCSDAFPRTRPSFHHSRLPDYIREGRLHEFWRTTACGWTWERRNPTWQAHLDFPSPLPRIHPEAALRAFRGRRLRGRAPAPLWRKTAV